MQEISLVMLAAGNSTRFGLECKKQWLRVENEPLWKFVTRKISDSYNFKEVFVVANKNEISYMKRFSDFKFIVGGDSRQESLKNALKYVNTDYVLVSDVARACINKDFLLRIINSISLADCIVPKINISDTVIFDEKNIDRNKVFLLQTPQLSKTNILQKALDTKEIFTDDSSAIKKSGGKIFYVDGSEEAIKITFLQDLQKIRCIQKPSKDQFVGYGFDVHQFESKKPMFLGGIKIEEQFGFKAHSDGDVLIHALIDAILGAAGLGDIGELFSDANDDYKNIDSTLLLKEVSKFVKTIGFEFVNFDISIMAEIPKINPYKEKMIDRLSKILELEKWRINIKATTMEKLGFIGNKEGLAVSATANLKFFDWTKI